MYQSQLLALAPGESVFSRYFLARFFFQRFSFSECLFLKQEPNVLLPPYAYSRFVSKDQSISPKKVYLALYYIY